MYISFLSKTILSIIQLMNKNRYRRLSILHVCSGSSRKIFFGVSWYNNKITFLIIGTASY